MKLHNQALQLQVYKIHAEESLSHSLVSDNNFFKYNTEAFRNSNLLFLLLNTTRLNEKAQYKKTWPRNLSACKYKKTWLRNLSACKYIIIIMAGSLRLFSSLKIIYYHSLTITQTLSSENTLCALHQRALLLELAAQHQKRIVPSRHFELLLRSRSHPSHFLLYPHASCLCARILKCAFSFKKVNYCWHNHHIPQHKITLVYLILASSFSNFCTSIQSCENFKKIFCQHNTIHRRRKQNWSGQTKCL